MIIFCAEDNEIGVFFGGTNLAKGAVVLNFGEYYLMFGWLGIIIGSFIFGFILKKLWIWILIHQDEPIAIPTYDLPSDVNLGSKYSTRSLALSRNICASSKDKT